MPSTEDPLDSAIRAGCFVLPQPPLRQRALRGACWTSSPPLEFLLKREHVLLLGPTGVGRASSPRPFAIPPSALGTPVRFVHSTEGESNIECSQP